MNSSIIPQFSILAICIYEYPYGFKCLGSVPSGVWSRGFLGNNNGASDVGVVEIVEIVVSSLVRPQDCLRSFVVGKSEQQQWGPSGNDD